MPGVINRAADFRHHNVEFRGNLDTYANVVRCMSFDGIKTHHSGFSLYQLSLECLISAPLFHLNLLMIRLLATFLLIIRTARWLYLFVGLPLLKYFCRDIGLLQLNIKSSKG